MANPTWLENDIASENPSTWEDTTEKKISGKFYENVSSDLLSYAYEKSVIL
jgi:hypothetical protein